MDVQWGDVPTWGLFAGAVATAIYARLAFRKQSDEVRILGEQLADQHELTKQQAAAIQLQHDQLPIQSGQLDLQRRELEQQQVINEKQADVADLQVQELRDSIEQRKTEAVERRRGQASRVWIGEHQELHSYGQPGDPKPGVVARVINGSEQPIYNVLVSWHLGTAPRGQDSIDILMPGNEGLALKSGSRWR